MIIEGIDIEEYKFPVTYMGHKNKAQIKADRMRIARIARIGFETNKKEVRSTKLQKVGSRFD